MSLETTTLLVLASATILNLTPKRIQEFNQYEHTGSDLAVYESGLTLLTQRDKVIAQTEHALSEGLQEKLETREQVVEYLSDYLTPQQMVQFGYL